MRCRLPDALTDGAGLAFEAPQIGPDDIAFLQYTGGTTGLAKGAILLHRNVLANVEQVRCFVTQELKVGEEVCITCLPLYHILALVLNCMLYFQLGGKQVLITNPRDLDRFVDTLATSRFSFMVGVNTLFNALVNHPRFAQIDFSSLRLLLRWRRADPGGRGAALESGDRETAARRLRID